MLLMMTVDVIKCRALPELRHSTEKVHLQFGVTTALLTITALLCQPQPRGNGRIEEEPEVLSSTRAIARARRPEKAYFQNKRPFRLPQPHARPLLPHPHR